MASVVASTIEVQKPAISGIAEICPESSGQLDAGSYNSYVWSTGSTNRSITIDRAGSYSVMVFNDRGCSNADTTEVLLLSDMSLAIDEIMDVSCFGASDGSILYQTAGGVGEPQVSWSDEDGPIDSLFNLSGGIYTAQMTDGSSCLIERSATLAEPRTLLSFLEPTGETGILDSNGVISVQILGGTPPYQYLWSNGSTELNQTGLPPGKYTLTVTDASNCTYVDSTLVEPFSCSLAVGINPKPVSCAGGSDGSASLVIIGGIGDISYEWSTGSTAPELTDVPAGNYTITLVDDIACKRVISFQIKQPETPPLEIMVDSTNTGPGPAYIRVSVMGGAPPYTYEWLKDGVTYSNLEDLENPPSGIYQLTVRDAGGCVTGTDEFDFTVTSSREQSLLQQKLSVFPNPVSERLSIRKELLFSRPIQVIILDMLGRKIHQEILPADQKQITIDVIDFPSGMYWVHFRMGSERANQKIVIH